MLVFDYMLCDGMCVCVCVCCLFLCAGERRIRVHTLSLPVTDQLSHLYARANVLAITGTLANLGMLRGGKEGGREGGKDGGGWKGITCMLLVSVKISASGSEFVVVNLYC